jgi:hypothetical protein
LLRILQDIEAPCSFQELVPPAGEKEARFAFLHAPLMRNRLTLGDALIFFGFDRHALWRRIWRLAQVPL